MKTFVIGFVVWTALIAATVAVTAYEFGKALLECVVAGKGKERLREVQGE